MIRAQLFRRGDAWCGFLLEGHSEDRPAGESVVCAAVSSAAYLAANTVLDVCGCQAEAEVREGYLFLRVTQQDLTPCQIILEGFYRHLQALQEQYSKMIQLICTEV